MRKLRKKEARVLLLIKKLPQDMRQVKYIARALEWDYHYTAHVIRQLELNQFLQSHIGKAGKKHLTEPKIDVLERSVEVLGNNLEDYGIQESEPELEHKPEAVSETENSLFEG